MGGGDLNSKKSWHPNTMKNQERVWKAEQAAAEEKKKMIELQRERAEERDRAELNNLIKNDSGLSTDNRLSWMYDKPDKKVDQEAYLLGKALNKNAEQDKTEDVIPAVSRRVVGSSMITATGDAQVDMTRKLREDPLLLIKERERAARAALLNNPLQRRKLAELLRKEQDQRKESKDKKKSKKKSKDLDGILAAKLSALGGQKGIDLATLLNSDDSSSASSSSDDSHKKTKKRKRKKSHKVKKSKKKRDISSNSESNRSVHKRKIDKDANPSKKQSSKNNEFDHERVSRKRRSSEGGYDSDSDVPKKSRNDSSDRRERNERGRVQRQDRTQYNRREDGHKSRDSDGDRRGGLSEAERAARLADMAAAGAERERRRAERVGRQRAGDAAPAPAPRAPRPQHALPDSLEARLRSNRHYIQRDKRHMNEHFARR